MKRVLLFFIFAFGSLISFSQSAPAGADICGAVEQDRINRLKYPGMQTLDDFEVAITKKVEEIERNRRLGKTQAAIVTLSVVVHIVHNGEAVGTGTNLSQAQVQAQLEVLNEDFRRKSGTPGFNNSPVGADIEIEFCLTSVSNTGATMSEPGIHRVRGSKTTWTRNDIESQLKPQTIWNANQFYNIWVLDFGGVDENLLGYAQFPTGSKLPGLENSNNPGLAKTDGVVIQYSSFGSVDKGTFPVMKAPYNHGRTLSHETGHWLGLRHIWGDGQCGNDFVGDTPIHHGENRNCPSTKISCDGVNFEMPQNYMDYSDDACMNIFTLGQKGRIRAVMELSERRKGLPASNLCGSVVAAPPVADFTAEKLFVLRGGAVTYTDLSTNFPTKWKWEFENGDPSTSNLQNPQVVYSTPGKFKVTLTASNKLGDSDPVTVIDFMEVSEQGLCDSLVNFLPTYTPSVLKMKDYGDYTGYLTGHSSAKNKAISEYFSDTLGYAYVSGVIMKFAKVYAKTENSTATITVWNARGLQNGPGSVIEQKTVLLKPLLDDVANNRPTLITFDRETPVFSRAFHVGVQLAYEGDSLAIESSAEGEATTLTSWVQNASGVWQPFSIAYGANMAMNIMPAVGMKPSVQVASSKIYINPGEEVILNARGASIFEWNSSNSTVHGALGPQLIVRPVETTVYITNGSGLDLCNASTSTTIYVKEGEITGVKDSFISDVTLYPNPGTNTLNVRFENAYRGDVQLEIRSTLGQVIHTQSETKNNDRFDKAIDMGTLPGGVYITNVRIGDHQVYGKWIKN